MELTDKNYETIIKNNDKPVFIDFYSPTCGPCQILMQVIEEGLEAYAEEHNVMSQETQSWQRRSKYSLYRSPLLSCPTGNSNIRSWDLKTTLTTLVLLTNWLAKGRFSVVYSAKVFLGSETLSKMIFMISSLVLLLRRACSVMLKR